MKSFNGITIVYADSVYGHKVFQAATDLGFKLIITEEPFHNTPQSQRIEWCKDIIKLMLEKDKGTSAILTNDYYFIRMIESVVPEDKFQIHHLDTGETVSKFVDLKPNPTLENGEYLYRASVRAALKQPL
jgi:hypothetical protein